jgi:hypothetical protein
LDLLFKGWLLRGKSELSTADIALFAIILATRRGAFAYALTDVTIRCLGPLLDCENVMTLKPQIDTLFVFAVLDITYSKAVLVVSDGEPLCLMGGLGSSASAVNPTIAFSTVGDGAGNGRS